MSGEADEPAIALGEARVVIALREVVVLGRDRRAQVLEGDTAELARVILDAAAAPRSRESILARVAEASGTEVLRGGVVDQLVDALIGSNALRVVDPGVSVEPPTPAPAPGARPRIVLGLTGAVQSIHAPAMIQALQGRGMDVRVAMSRAALRIVGPLGLEALTHAAVATSMWSRDPERPVPHLELATWADVVVVCPASATTLGRIARGDFADLVAAVALTTQAPVLLAPSMNEAMLAAPSVRRNIEQLIDDGFHVIRPGRGVEVADAPAARRPRAGVAPGAATLADIVAVVVNLRRR